MTHRNIRLTEARTRLLRVAGTDGVRVGPHGESAEALENMGLCLWYRRSDILVWTQHGQRRAEEIGNGE